MRAAGAQLVLVALGTLALGPWSVYLHVGCYVLWRRMNGAVVVVVVVADPVLPDYGIYATRGRRGDGWIEACCTCQDAGRQSQPKDPFDEDYDHENQNGRPS